MLTHSLSSRVFRLGAVGALLGGYKVCLHVLNVTCVMSCLENVQDIGVILPCA